MAYRVFPTPQRLWAPQLYLLFRFSQNLSLLGTTVYTCLFVFWLYWDATSLETENLSLSAQNSQSLEQGLALTRYSINICGRKEGTFPVHFALLTPLKLWAPPMLFPGSTTHFQPLLCLDKCNLFSSIQLHGLLSLQSLCGLSTLVQDIGCAMLYWNSLLVSNWTGNSSWAVSFPSHYTQYLAQSLALQSNTNLFWCVLNVDVMPHLLQNLYPLIYLFPNKLLFSTYYRVSTPGVPEFRESERRLEKTGNL